jgi:hypothetical protein
MAEIYAPQGGASTTNVPTRGSGRTTPARQTNKRVVVTAVIAVAAIVILLALLLT